MESLLTAPLVEKLLKDEIDVLISVDPMFNDDRWVRREIYRESFLVLSKDKIGNPLSGSYTNLYIASQFALR